MMHTRLSIPLTLCAVFLLPACSQYKTATIGYCTGQPKLDSTPVKHWTNDNLKSPYGNAEWYGKLCTVNFDIRCDAFGNWSAINFINNGQLPHAYSMRIDFGHQDNNDPKTFTPYASYLVPSVKCLANQAQALHAAGAADPNILVHFADINAIRPVFVLEDSGQVFGNNNTILWISKG